MFHTRELLASEKELGGRIVKQGNFYALDYKTSLLPLYYITTLLYYHFIVLLNDSWKKMRFVEKN